MVTAAYAYMFNVSKSLQIRSPDPRARNIVVMISLPFIIVGVLFIISHFLHRSKKLTANNKVK